MKVYQVVSSRDGTRSECFSAENYAQVAISLKMAASDNKLLLDDYVLVLVEDADSKPYASRAPMMRVATVIDTFGGE